MAKFIELECHGTLANKYRILDLAARRYVQSLGSRDTTLIAGHRRFQNNIPVNSVSLMYLLKNFNPMNLRVRYQERTRFILSNPSNQRVYVRVWVNRAKRSTDFHRLRVPVWKNALLKYLRGTGASTDNIQVIGAQLVSFGYQANAYPPNQVTDDPNNIAQLRKFDAYLQFFPSAYTTPLNQDQPLNLWNAGDGFGLYNSIRQNYYEATNVNTAPGYPTPAAINLLTSTGAIDTTVNPPVVAGVVDSQPDRFYLNGIFYSWGNYDYAAWQNFLHYRPNSNRYLKRFFSSRFFKLALMPAATATFDVRGAIRTINPFTSGMCNSQESTAPYSGITRSPFDPPPPSVVTLAASQVDTNQLPDFNTQDNSLTTAVGAYSVSASDPFAMQRDLQTVSIRFKGGYASHAGASIPGVGSSDQAVLATRLLVRKHYSVRYKMHYKPTEVLRFSNTVNNYTNGPAESNADFQQFFPVVTSSAQIPRQQN